MKASRIHRFGPPEVIELEELPRPEPGANEVLVRVEAAGVGPWDGWIRAGKSVLEQPLPLTLGSDLSGTVVALGAGVEKLSQGDQVFGVTNPRFVGAYAQYAVANAGMLATKPRRLNHEEAASIPVVAVTALQMLFDHAQVRAGQRVLIHGAGGNVGAYAVQLALRAGAHVVGTDRAQGALYAQSLGAQQVIDISGADFTRLVAPVDVVIDTVGGQIQTRSFSVLTSGGILVSSVSQPNAEEASASGVRTRFILVDVTSAALARIGELVDAGDLRTHLGPVLPLAEARQAHEMLEGLRPRVPGKIVLSVGDGAAPTLR
jgi:NADPH:quinone reductase-like Zn-dependent oxidoreductase